MRKQTWAVGILTCVVSLLFSVPRASAQDLRTGVEQLAAQIAKAGPEGKQLRVAVADFPDLQGVTSDLGRFISSRLTTRLAQSPKFFVIERQRLGQVLAELKFSMSDLVDPAKAKQLGRMAGVEAIVVGTVSDLGNQVDLDARMIEIETNRMLLGAAVTISKDPTVEDMLKRGRDLPTTAPTPAPSAPVGGAPSPGPPEGLRGFRYSHAFFTMEVVNVEVVGDEVKFTAVYTNRTDSPRNGGLGSTDINRTYLVDNFGNRYAYTGDSFKGRRSFAPQIPERIWITFGKLRPGASSINLVLHWVAGEHYQARDNVVVMIRGLPLPR